MSDDIIFQMLFRAARMVGLKIYEARFGPDFVTITINASDVYLSHAFDRRPFDEYAASMRSAMPQPVTNLPELHKDLIFEMRRLKDHMP